MAGVDWGAMHASTRAVFGEPAYYVPDGQPELEHLMNGVFNRFQVLVPDPNGMGAPISAMRTTFGVRLADFPQDFEHRPRDRLLVRGLTFDVMDAQPDGHGWVTLELGLIG